MDVVWLMCESEFASSQKRPYWRANGLCAAVLGVAHCLCLYIRGYVFVVITFE